MTIKSIEICPKCKSENLKLLNPMEESKLCECGFVGEPIQSFAIETPQYIPYDWFFTNPSNPPDFNNLQPNLELPPAFNNRAVPRGRF